MNSQQAAHSPCQNLFVVMRTYLLTLLLAVLSTGHAFAHSAGESYFFFQAKEQQLTGRMEIIINDLGMAIDIDDDKNGEVSTQEFDNNIDRIYDFIRPHVKFQIDGKTIPMNITGHQFREASFGTYALIDFTILDNQPVPETMKIEHTSFMEDIRPSHKVYLVIEDNARTGLRDNEGTVSHLFEDKDAQFELSFLGEPAIATFLRFTNLGIYHILSGFDHLAFLFVLLLPTVLLVQAKEWVPQQGFRRIFINVVKIVTTFTIAHSITLSLAALGIVSFPTNIVEALIALSIVIVALDNVFGPSRFSLLPVVFLLGLLHGLGFANVLAPYGVADSAILVTLLGFNIGVEIGQLGLIIVTLPILYLLRNWKYYVPVVVRGGSILLIAVATYWFAERGLAALKNIITWLSA